MDFYIVVKSFVLDILHFEKIKPFGSGLVVVRWDWVFATKVYHYVVVYNCTKTKKFGEGKFCAIIKT